MVTSALCGRVEEPLGSHTQLEEYALSKQIGVPLIVVSVSQDHVEAVNAALREADCPAHCHWISNLNDLSEALAKNQPDLLVYFDQEFDQPLGATLRVRNQNAPGVPVILVREEVDEAAMAAVLQAGAQDLVSLEHRGRLQAVANRELRAYSLERALDDTLSSAREYKSQLHALVADSADAIAHVQEGIIVEVNPAWAELFGYAQTDALLAQPLMDFFAADSHAALKGALVACTRGRWENDELRVSRIGQNGAGLNIDLKLELTAYDGNRRCEFAWRSKRARRCNRRY